MKSKIVDFPYEFLVREKQLALTPLMVDTLLEACAKQKERIRYGPMDIKRSFASLVNRGLIIRKYVSINEDTELLWQVSNEAIIILQDMGIESSLLTFANVPNNPKIRSISISSHM